MIANPMTIQQNLVSMQDLTPTDVNELIDRAEEFKAGADFQTTEPIYVANMFFENSTRTHTSFEMAEHKLGLTVVDFDPKASSISKGETLHDTALTLDALGVNLLVIRHSEDHYYQKLIDGGDLDLALINAGAGSGEHPSQSLLDLMTIRENFGHFEGLKIVICGDISHSRVARSNAEILHKLGATLYFAGPDFWYDHDFDEFGTYCKIDDVLDDVDVVMMLRVQHERHSAEESFSKEGYHRQYGLTLQRAEHLKPSTIIMHPGPINRDVELASELVQCKQSRFVQQMTNGVFMRMAMLERVIRANHLGGIR